MQRRTKDNLKRINILDHHFPSATRFSAKKHDLFPYNRVCQTQVCWRSLLQEDGCSSTRLGHKQALLLHCCTPWVRQEVGLPHCQQERLCLLAGHHWHSAAPPAGTRQSGAHSPGLPAKTIVLDLIFQLLWLSCANDVQTRRFTHRQMSTSWSSSGQLHSYRSLQLAWLSLIRFPSVWMESAPADSHTLLKCSTRAASL